MVVLGQASLLPVYSAPAHSSGLFRPCDRLLKAAGAEQEGRLGSTPGALSHLCQQHACLLLTLDMLTSFLEEFP